MNIGFQLGQGWPKLYSAICQFYLDLVIVDHFCDIPGLCENKIFVFLITHTRSLNDLGLFKKILHIPCWIYCNYITILGNYLCWINWRPKRRPILIVWRKNPTVFILLTQGLLFCPPVVLSTVIGPLSDVYLFFPFVREKKNKYVLRNFR